MPLLSLESDRLDIRGDDDEDMARELGMAPIKVTSLTVPLCIPMLGGIWGSKGTPRKDPFLAAFACSGYVDPLFDGWGISRRLVGCVVSDTEKMLWMLEPLSFALFNNDTSGTGWNGAEGGGKE